MPASPGITHSGIAVLAWILAMFVLSGGLALVGSAIVLRLYRRRIGRLMFAEAGTALFRAGTPLVGAGTATEETAADSHIVRQCPGSVSAPAPRWSGEHLYEATTLEPRRLALRYAQAGALFAVVVGTAAYFALSQLQVNYLRAAAHPLQLVLTIWIVAWPIVLTANAVASLSSRQMGILVGAYGAVFLVLSAVMSSIPTEPAVLLGAVELPAWSGESPLRLGARWLAFNLAPTALILLFRRRRVRAAAPLILALTTFFSEGVLGLMTHAVTYSDATVQVTVYIARALDAQPRIALTLYLLLVCIAAGLLFAALGWQVLRWMRSSYHRKRASDQSIGIDAQWLIFAAFYAAVLAYAGPAWALAPLVAFCAFRIALRATWGRAHRDPADDDGPALLVLRVFSLGTSSEVLFDGITRRWRHAGSVLLIAGPDLALSTLAPRQFLAFLTGGLPQLFIRSRADIDVAVAGLDRRRDADGRFRINDFFCSGDSWREMLERLVTQADVVLMDLRNFRASNSGCIYEIRALLHVRPLARLIFVVDATTDRSSLNARAERSAGHAAAAIAQSPRDGSRCPARRDRNDRLSGSATAAAKNLSGSRSGRARSWPGPCKVFQFHMGLLAATMSIVIAADADRCRKRARLPHTSLGIQRRPDLVEQHDLRLHGERTGDRSPSAQLWRAFRKGHLRLRHHRDHPALGILHGRLPYRCRTPHMQGDA